MSQPSVASYFNNRKRAAIDDNSSQKSKILLLDTPQQLTKAVISKKIHTEACSTTVVVTRKRVHTKLFCDEGETGKLEVKVSARSGQKIRRIGAASAAMKAAPPVAESQQPIVKFFKLGDISPKKKIIQPNDESPVKMMAFASKESFNNIDKGMKTPVKLAPEEVVASTSRSSKLPQDLSISEIRSKLSRSSKMALLATSLNKLQSGMDKLDQMKATRLNAKPSDTLMSRRRKQEEVVPSKNLKEFESIELEVPFR
jgi:chromatin licensing and DNA replication factor 1